MTPEDIRQEEQAAHDTYIEYLRAVSSAVDHSKETECENCAAFNRAREELVRRIDGLKEAEHRAKDANAYSRAEQLKIAWETTQWVLNIMDGRQ